MRQVLETKATIPPIFFLYNQKIWKFEVILLAYWDTFQLSRSSSHSRAVEAYDFTYRPSRSNKTGIHILLVIYLQLWLCSVLIFSLKGTTKVYPQKYIGPFKKYQKIYRCSNNGILFVLCILKFYVFQNYSDNKGIRIVQDMPKYNVVCNESDKNVFMCQCNIVEEN